MRVVVAGWQGYLGSALTRMLLEAGHTVVGMDAGHYMSVPSGAAWHGSKNFFPLPMDVRLVEQWYRNLQHCDAVYHLVDINGASAARRVAETGSGRAMLFDVNATTVSQMLRAVFDHEVPRVFVVGDMMGKFDDGVYGAVCTARREAYEYGISGRQITDAVFRYVELPELFGPYRSCRFRMDRGINMMVGQAVKERMITLADPHRIGVHLFVEDAARYLKSLLSEKDVGSKVVRPFGSDTVRSDRAVAEMIVELLPGVEIHQPTTPEDGESFEIGVPDPGISCTNLTDGIRETIKAAKEIPSEIEWTDPFFHNDKQIGIFTKRERVDE